MTMFLRITAGGFILGIALLIITATRKKPKPVLLVVSIALALVCAICFVDVNSGYCPQNCRWVDMAEQAKNKRNNRHIEYNGETHNLSEWASILGIGYQTLYARLTIHGMTVEEAFSRRNKV